MLGVGKTLYLWLIENYYAAGSVVVSDRYGVGSYLVPHEGSVHYEGFTVVDGALPAQLLNTLTIAHGALNLGYEDRFLETGSFSHAHGLLLAGSPEGATAVLIADCERVYGVRYLVVPPQPYSFRYGVCYHVLPCRNGSGSSSRSPGGVGCACKTPTGSEHGDGANLRYIGCFRGV